MNVDLILLKAELQKEIRGIAQREEALQHHLSDLQKVVSFLKENRQIVERCQVGSNGSREGQIDSSGDIRSQSRGAGIQVCPLCEVKVLPTKDGRCPSCQTEFVLD